MPVRLQRAASLFVLACDRLVVIAILPSISKSREEVFQDAD